MSKPQLFDLRGLTVAQPMAGAIAAGVKRWENRSWQTKHVRRLGGLWIAVHAGARLYDGEWSREAMIEAGWAGMPEVEDLPRRAVLAVARVADIVPYSDALAGDPWAGGPYCWRIEDVHRFVEPIPWRRGALGLWRCPSVLVEQVREKLSEAA